MYKLTLHKMSWNLESKIASATFTSKTKCITCTFYINRQ